MPVLSVKACWRRWIRWIRWSFVAYFVFIFCVWRHFVITRRVRDVGSDWNKMLELVNETSNSEYFMVRCVVCDTKCIHKLDGMACWGLSLEVPPTHRPTVCATGHTHPPLITPHRPRTRTNYTQLYPSRYATLHNASYWPTVFIFHGRCQLNNELYHTASREQLCAVKVVQ